MHRLPQILAVFAVAVLAALTAPEARAHHVPAGGSSFERWCVKNDNYVYVQIRNVNNSFVFGSGNERQRACQVPNTYRTVNYEYCLQQPFPADYGAAYVYHSNEDKDFIGELATSKPDTVPLLASPENLPLCEEVVLDPDDDNIISNTLAAGFTESNRANANRPGPITRVTLVPGGIEIGGWTPPAEGTWTHYRVIRHHNHPDNSNVVNVSVARTAELENTLLDNGAPVPLVEGRTYWYRVAAVSPDEVSSRSIYDDSLSVTYRKLGSAVSYAHIPATGEGGGLTASIPSGQATLHGATVTFTAAPAAGWTLAAWEGDVENCVAPDLECVLTANTDLRVTARFARIIVAVEYEAVPPDGGNLTAPVPSGGTTVHGAALTFTATPSAGWTLAAWEGDVESCAAPALECVLLANADLRVTAHFARIVAVVEYAEFPVDKSGGTLTASVPSGETALLGATVTFTAAPAAGWYVEDWEGGGTADCSGLECAVTVVSDAAVLVTVHFAEAAVVRVETVGEPPRGGVLSAELPGTGFAFLGATVTFTAAPAAKWYVTGWNNGGCANIGAAATPGEEKQCVLTADADLLVTVNFAVARAVVYDETEVSARRTDADGGAAVASGETVADGKTIVFLATPPENHAVARWTNNNAEICAGQNPCPVAADADLSVRAEFASLLRTIAYAEIPDDKSGGTLTASVPSGGTTLLGAAVTFTAAPAAGWYAKEWTGEGGRCAGSRGTCALTVAARLFVTVRFAADCPGAQIVRDGACACAAGLVFADNDATCLPPADAALVEEVYRPQPVLATIRALLDDNANPNLTLANGAPLVFAAATLLLDQVMSVLITAGANPYATYEFQPGFPVNVLYNILDRRRSGFVNRVVHWGGAATIWAGSPTLDWSPSKGRSESAYNLMADSYLETELRGQFNKVGGYLLDLGAVCPDVILRGGVTGLPFELLCTSRHVCATARDNKIYDCRACPGAPLLDGNECVGLMQRCENAGWAHSAADDSCQVPLIGGDGSEHAGCHLSGVAQPQCAAVFGADFDFPQPVIESGATLRFAFNCDPDGDTGLIPATRNTNGATECSCAAAGEEEVGGVCAAAAVTVAAQSCADAGRTVLRDDGGGCAAAITLSGGTLYSRCYFSGALAPQCATVFGADFDFPAASMEGPFVYNCDPAESKGLIPATANTIMATECACSDEKELIGGVCVAAAVTVAAQNCADAGRTVLGDDGGGCAAAITLSGGTLYSRCYFSGGLSPQCADVFGADFPAASMEGPFVYNCDPEDKNGLIPATTNTITATECACPDGKVLIGGVCAAAAVTVAAQSCADAGRTVLGDDGGGCAAAITLSGGTLHSRCYFSGGLSPQCADCFRGGFCFSSGVRGGPLRIQLRSGRKQRADSGDVQHHYGDGMRLPRREGVDWRRLRGRRRHGCGAKLRGCGADGAGGRRRRLRGGDNACGRDAPQPVLFFRRAVAAMRDCFRGGFCFSSGVCGGPLRIQLRPGRKQRADSGDVQHHYGDGMRLRGAGRGGGWRRLRGRRRHGCGAKLRGCGADGVGGRRRRLRGGDNAFGRDAV